jgi:hypothetical protein
MQAATGTTVGPQMGWLKKKGKRRWFLIHNNALYWFAKEQKTVTFNHSSVKGCLELRGTTITVNNDKTHSLTLSNVKDMNYYVLSAPNDKVLNEWASSLRAAIEKANNLQVEESSVEIKRGVLIKKGKERLFALKSDSLMWFLSKTGSEKKAKGSLPLAEATVKRAQKPQYSLVITPKVGKVYMLTAHSQNECEEWLSAISKVIEDLASNKEANFKSGWLAKKGQQRWFMVKNGKLLWFKKMQKSDDATAQGYLVLADCTVTTEPAANGKYPFRLLPKNKKEYLLTATSEQECNDWVNAVIAGGALGEVVSSYSTEMRRQSVLSNKDSEEQHGNETQQQHPSSSQQPQSTTIDTKSATKGAGDLAPAAEKSGWLEKKGKRRWFVLKDGNLSWYNQPKHHQTGSNPNGSLKTSECCVDQIGELNGLYAFAIYSKKNKEQEYILMASSGTEMEDWVVALLLSGSVTDKEKSSMLETHPEEETKSSSVGALPEHDKNGWLEKKGRKRWFILRNGRLSWYKQLQEDEAGLSAPAGFLDMKECYVYKLETKLKGKYVFVIGAKNRESKKGEYFLLHADEKEVDEWIQVLIEKGGATRESGSVKKTGEEQKGEVFGIPLEELLQKEGNPPNGIPEVVEKCVTYIRAYGLEVEGIFRVSGEQLDVIALKELFEKRGTAKAEIDFSKTDFEIDVHAITGLLKLWLRELNPPLLTFELYQDFINAINKDVVEVKALVDRLPPANRRVLKYLLFFLQEVAAHAESNKMRPMNLAIVFSPNFLKSNRPAIEVLANSGHAATMTQMLITRVNDIFPEGPDTASPSESTSSESSSSSPSGSASTSPPTADKQRHNEAKVPGSGSVPPVTVPPRPKSMRTTPLSLRTVDTTPTSNSCITTLNSTSSSSSSSFSPSRSVPDSNPLRSTPLSPRGPAATLSTSFSATTGRSLLSNLPKPPPVPSTHNRPQFLTTRGTISHPDSSNTSN